MQGGPYETKALDDVSLTIHDGEFVGLIGHTGSGKSTLVQHLNGLILPTSGKITVDGMDLADKNTDKRAIRRRVGLLGRFLRFASGLLRLRFPGRLLFPFLLWFGEVPCSGRPFRGFRFAGSGPKWRPLRCGRNHRAATCRRWAGQSIRGCCCRPDYLKMRPESPQFRLDPSRPAPRTFYPQRVLRSTLSVRTSRLAAPGPLIRTADAGCSGMGC